MADLASQLEKITMAHAFLDWVDHLLSLAHVSLVKNPRLAVTTIFQTWLQWFKTMGSGAEWLELANVEKECCQLYKQYKGKEWGEAVVGGSGVTKVKSRELVESDKEGDGNDGSDNDSDNNMLLAQKQPARPTLVASTKQLWTVASKEGEGDVEMRETTPLVMVTEVEQEASNMEVKGEEEFEAAPVAIEEDKEEDEGAGEVKGTWSDTPLQQVGNDKLEWLGKDLA
ncbi:hypothetical protein E4T56_gene15970 [Termitomyces sp. T112]|nr:hypothetical protein E4T56_gene15970 [Termitomyces sp. T112]